MSDTPLLEVRNLKVHFPLPGTLLRPKSGGSVKAVDGVSFHLNRGETLGLVGESGCGKSSTGMAVLRMTPVSDGEIHLEGEDITHMTGRALRPLRRRMQMIYQDPFGALDPRMRVLDIIGEPLKVHKLVSGRKAYREEVLRLMALVGLLPDMCDRYPHEFSGGQRQRIGIARALAAQPDILICDEPVSALDVSIQAQIINLLKDLQQQLGLTYLFVAHDLAVVRHICDRVMVMYLGHVVEVADSETLYTNPQHPYTQALMSAIPIPDPRAESRREVDPSIEGEVPSPVNPPSGCPFHPRCKHATDICRQVAPQLRDTEAGHAVSCHLFEPQAAARPITKIASMA